MNDFYRVIILLFIAGFTSVTGQSVFLRELLSQASPNEAGLAYMIFFWAAGGVISARFLYEKLVLKLNTVKLMVLTAVLPVFGAFIILLSPVFLRFLAGIFTERGVVESLICASPALLNGMLTGLLFTVLSLSLTLQKKESIARSAAVVFALGGISGGIIFSVFAAGKLPGLMILYWLGIINIALTYVLFRVKGPDGKVITLSVVTAAIIYLMPLMGGIPERFDAYTSALAFRNSKVLHSAETSGEKTVITKKEQSYSLYVNGIKRYDYPDAGLAGFIKDSAPKGSVLLIEGGYAGGVNEIKKYPAAVSVSAVEPFSDSAYASAKFFGADISNTVNVRFIYGDAEAFFKSAPDRKYDTILFNTPGDSSLSSLRFKSAGVRKLAEAALNAGGNLRMRAGESSGGHVKNEFNAAIKKDFFTGVKGTAAAALAVIIAVLGIAAALGGKRESKNSGVLIFSAGTGFISFTLLIITAFFFQGLYGGLYRYFGLLLAIFSAGSLAGAFLSGRDAEWTRPLMIGALLLCAAMMFTLHFSAGSAVSVMVFAAAAGFIQGAAFNSRLRYMGAAPVHAAELSGAAIAAVCCGILILPSFGAAAVTGLAAVISAVMFLAPSGNK